MKVKSESEVAQSCPTLSDPMNYSPPGSSTQGIFQARVLEWGAIAFSIFLRQGASNLFFFFSEKIRSQVWGWNSNFVFVLLSEKFDVL